MIVRWHRVLYGALLGAFCLIIALTAWASADSGVLTVPVNDTVTLFGITYRETGTLTLTPVTAAPAPAPAPAPSPVPTPGPTPLPAPVPSLTIAGFRDAARNWLAGAAVAPGATVYIDGTGFGAAPGTVLFAAVAPAAVLSWTDTEIAVTVPAVTTSGIAIPSAQTVTVRRADGLTAVEVAFPIKSPP